MSCFLRSALAASSSAKEEEEEKYALLLKSAAFHLARTQRALLSAVAPSTYIHSSTTTYTLFYTTCSTATYLVVQYGCTYVMLRLLNKNDAKSRKAALKMSLSDEHRLALVGLSRGGMHLFGGAKCFFFKNGSLSAAAIFYVVLVTAYRISIT